MIRSDGPSCLGVVGLVVSLALSTGCAESRGSDDSPGAQLLASLSAFESEVLVDRTVSLAELEAAGQAFAECLSAAGFTPVNDGDGIGPDSIAAEIATPSEDLPEAERLAREQRQEERYEGCRDLVDAVSAVWVLQNQASEAEIQATLATLPDCLSEAGLELPSGVSPQDAARAAQEDRTLDEAGRAAVDACLTAAARSSVSAPAGLAEALARLDLSGSG